MTFRGSTFTKPRAKLKPFSEKKLAQLDSWEATSKRLLAERPRCEAQAIFGDWLLAHEDDRVTAALKACWGRSTHAHHVIRRSQGGSDEDTNIACLCDACHLGFVHQEPALATELGLLRPGWKR